MKTSSYSLMDRIKPIVATGLVTLLGYFSTGCANIQPFVYTRTTEGGEFEGRIGVQIGKIESEPEATWGRRLTSPFRISEWKNHPYKTAGMTFLYLGVAAAAASGGGGSSKPAPVQETPTTSTKPKPKPTPTTTTPSEPSSPSEPSAPSGPGGGATGGGN